MGGTLNIPDEPKEHDVFKEFKAAVAPNIDKQKLQDMGLSSRDADRIISNGGGTGGGRNPYERLETFAGNAQQKYLFDDIPLKILRDNGSPSHAISKRGPWRVGEGSLEPFEAAAVRDLFISNYAEEARKLREMPARHGGKSREIFKDIRLNGNDYHIRVKYFAEKDSYYEATIYRKDRDTR